MPSSINDSEVEDEQDDLTVKQIPTTTNAESPIWALGAIYRNEHLEDKDADV